MSRAGSPLRERMIFNLGARRSGTYWLQRIVTAHPEVAAVPSETHLLSHGIAPLFDRFQHDDPRSEQVGVTYMPRERLLDATRDLLDEVFSQYLDSGANRVAERTPLHAQHLGLIHELYPDARFVHIIRDGRDVARSLASQRWGPRTIGLAAEEWRYTVATARGAGLPPERYREVRYEELLAHPEPIVRGLLEWLELPLGPQVLDAALAEAVREENVDRARPGVSAQKWRDDFSVEDLAAFNEVAGRELRELGYPFVEPSTLPAPTAARAAAPTRGRRSRLRRLGGRS